MKSHSHTGMPVWTAWHSLLLLTYSLGLAAWLKPVLSAGAQDREPSLPRGALVHQGAWQYLHSGQWQADARTVASAVRFLLASGTDSPSPGR